MKIVLFLLLSLSLFAFEGKKMYQCVPKYTVANGNPQEYPSEYQQKNSFYLVFNKKLSRIKTSNNKIYSLSNTREKGKLYMSKEMVNGRALTYKLRTASLNGLYRSVNVVGYGNLINEYVLCKKIKTKKKNKKKEESND